MLKAQLHFLVGKHRSWYDDDGARLDFLDAQRLLRKSAEPTGSTASETLSKADFINASELMLRNQLLLGAKEQANCRYTAAIKAFRQGARTAFNLDGDLSLRTAVYELAVAKCQLMYGDNLENVKKTLEAACHGILKSYPNIRDDKKIGSVPLIARSALLETIVRSWEAGCTLTKIPFANALALKMIGCEDSTPDEVVAEAYLHFASSAAAHDLPLEALQYAKKSVESSFAAAPASESHLLSIIRLIGQITSNHPSCFDDGLVIVDQIIALTGDALLNDIEVLMLEFKNECKIIFALELGERCLNIVRSVVPTNSLEEANFCVHCADFSAILNHPEKAEKFHKEALACYPFERADAFKWQIDEARAAHHTAKTLQTTASPHLKIIRETDTRSPSHRTSKLRYAHMAGATNRI